MRRRRSSDDNAALGCVVYVLLAIFFMPIVGLVLAFGKNHEKRPLGWVLLIVGIILWVVLAVAGS